MLQLSRRQPSPDFKHEGGRGYGPYDADFQDYLRAKLDLINEHYPFAWHRLRIGEDYFRHVRGRRREEAFRQFVRTHGAKIREVEFHEILNTSGGGSPLEILAEEEAEEYRRRFTFLAREVMGTVGELVELIVRDCSPRFVSVFL